MTEVWHRAMDRTTRRRDTLWRDEREIAQMDQARWIRPDGSGQMDKERIGLLVVPENNTTK